MSQKKTRPTEDPYEIWENKAAGWTWRVLKKYQSAEREAENPHARWYCAVSSPYTYGEYELGDVYVRDIKTYAERTL